MSDGHPTQVVPQACRAWVSWSESLTLHPDVREDVEFRLLNPSWFSARKRKHDYKLGKYSFILEKKSWQATNFEKLIYNT